MFSLKMMMQLKVDAQPMQIFQPLTAKKKLIILFEENF